MSPVSTIEVTPSTRAGKKARTRESVTKQPHRFCAILTLHLFPWNVQWENEFFLVQTIVNLCQKPNAASWCCWCRRRCCRRMPGFYVGCRGISLETRLKLPQPLCNPGPRARSRQRLSPPLPPSLLLNVRAKEGLPSTWASRATGHPSSQPDPS